MATEGSLYDRLGGIDAITAVVRAVADRQLKDDRINHKFARTNTDRLIKEFVDQICEATGGPCTYTGRSMTETQYNMGVTNGESDALWKTSSRSLTTLRSEKPSRTSSWVYWHLCGERDRRSRFEPDQNPAALRVHTGTCLVSRLAHRVTLRNHRTQGADPWRTHKPYPRLPSADKGVRSSPDHKSG